jgi:hypothetical protein
MKLTPRAAILVIVALLAAGCGTTQVAVKDDAFPRPLIEPLPMRVGLHFQPEFASYQHEEELRDHGRWSITVGPAQVALFQRVLPAMFAGVEEVESIDAAGHLDAVVSVSLEDFQFAVPRQTRSSFYEVWVRYRLDLYDGTGRPIAQWPLTGYGKANEHDHSRLSPRSQTVLQEAAMIALRDAGAFLALGFAEQAEIRNWLEERGIRNRARARSARGAAFGEGS